MQHTPGPWKWLREWGDRDEPRDVLVSVANRTGTHLGYWEEAPGLGYAAQVNVRLMAAAPDLLDALQTILANTEQGAHRDYDHLAKDIADCAAAAIAKAKGE